MLFVQMILDDVVYLSGELIQVRKKYHKPLEPFGCTADILHVQIQVCGDLIFTCIKTHVVCSCSDRVKQTCVFCICWMNFHRNPADLVRLERFHNGKWQLRFGDQVGNMFDFDTLW